MEIYTFEGRPVMVGIDEAGRGPVVGPMVYGCAFCPIVNASEIASLGFDDSKKLSESKREEFFEIIKKRSDIIGYLVHCLSANELSTKMLRKQKYNLNSISYDSCIGLIRKLISSGVNVREVYVDTVGDPAKYKDRLSLLFPGVAVRVEKKADSLFPIVSAASICAKVTRDSVINDIKKCLGEIGSGYPADPRTVEWLESSFDRLFGFSRDVRFSWSTVDTLMEKRGAVEIDWHEEDENSKGRASILSMLRNHGSKRKRAKLFTSRGLAIIDSGISDE